MQGQPEFQPLLRQNRREVLAGAYRLNARYLLDGGQPGPALRAYAQALVNSPRFALKHWHRMLYALLSLIGGSGLSRWYYRYGNGSERVRLLLGDLPEIETWPGLRLERAR
jgi:hypothetical protein